LRNNHHAGVGRLGLDEDLLSCEIAMEHPRGRLLVRRDGFAGFERQEDDVAQVKVGLGEGVKGGEVVGKDWFLTGGEERHGGRTGRPVERSAGGGRSSHAQEIQQPGAGIGGVVVGGRGYAANLTRDQGKEAVNLRGLVQEVAIDLNCQPVPQIGLFQASRTEGKGETGTWPKVLRFWQGGRACMRMVLARMNPTGATEPRW